MGPFGLDARPYRIRFTSTNSYLYNLSLISLFFAAKPVIYSDEICS